MAVFFPILWVNDDDLNTLLTGKTGTFSDKMFVYLRVDQSKTGAIDDMLYSFLGDLGYTGTIEERMGLWKTDAFSLGGTTVAASVEALTLTVNAAGITFDVEVISSSVALTITGKATNVFLAGIDIPAIIFNGAADYRAFTTAPTGAASGTAWATIWSGTFQSDGSAMTLREISNGTGVVMSLRRTATNTIEYKGWQSDASTAVFSNATAAIPASTGRVIILASCSGTTSYLRVITVSDGTIVSGTNTPGSAGAIDATGVWYYGRTSSGSEYVDAIINYEADAAEAIDFSDSALQEEFYDSTNNEIRDPGSDGSNPFTAQPLVSFQVASADALTNSGSGGDADAGSNSGDDTSPGTYAADYSSRTGATVLSEGLAWYEADFASNGITSGTPDVFDNWAEKNADSEDLTATTTSRPSYLDTAGVISAEFDGANDGFTDASCSWKAVFQAGGTLVFVFRLTAGITNFCRLFECSATGATDSARIQVFSESGGNATLRLETTYNTTGGKYDITVPVGSVNVLIVRHDKTDAASLKMKLNGSDLTIDSGITQNQASAGTPIAESGTMYVCNRSALNLGFKGGLYVVASDDAEYSDADATLVDAYLAAKYQ